MDCMCKFVKGRYIKGNKIISLVNNKCLYVINSINPGLDECKDSNEQVDHYFYFNIIDNRYVCVKNKKDPKRYCLNGDYLRFEGLNGDYSEWIIENINGNRIIESIYDIVETDSDIDKSKYRNTQTCWSEILGYPCCSNPNTEVVHIYESGSWGLENDDWRGIIETQKITGPISSDDNCPSTITNQGYPCCKDQNIQIVSTDENDGLWGVENGDWCGIINPPSTATVISYQIVDSNYKPVWIYNPNLKQCLYAQSSIASEKQSKSYKLLIGNCGSNNKFKWYFDSHNKSYIHSALNINKCLYLDDVENGKLKVDNCNYKDNGVFEYVSNGLVKSSLSSNGCLGKGDKNNDSSNANGGYLLLCDKNRWPKVGDPHVIPR